MDLDEKLAELEEKVEEEKQATQDTMTSENAITKSLGDMSYEETKENIKKVALVATGQDQNYVEELHEQSKDVLTGSIALEKAKVERETQEIILEQEKIATEKERELNERLKAKYGAKLDQQEYHYKSLKPILETFWIKSPMNIYVMWTIAILGCLTLIYPAKLLISATFGNLIAGANSEHRKGLAKGCIWTMVAILGAALVALMGIGVYKVYVMILG